jgi:hypothetical protein
VAFLEVARGIYLEFHKFHRPFPVSGNLLISAQRKEGFQFFCVLMKAVGVPERKLKECSHYLSLVRTVVRRFNMVPVCSKRLFIRVFRSEILLNC